MHILFLDTASHNHSLALCTEEKALAFKALLKMGDAEIVPTLEESLEKVGWEYKDLTHIACVIGPGGFKNLMQFQNVYKELSQS